MSTTITGAVITGLSRGKRIGFPTLNLDVSGIENLPYGVFAALATFDDVIHAPAAVHIGLRPTINAPFSCEVHVINRDITTSPATVTVQLHKKIRDVIKFDSIEELQKQLEQDIKTATVYLNDL